jgi:hypothetical protein
VNPDESNLAPRVTGKIDDSVAVASASATWPLWWIPAGLAMALLVIEWGLYQRRVTI